jgi:hypothetical protein
LGPGGYSLSYFRAQRFGSHLGGAQIPVQALAFQVRRLRTKE